MKITFGRIFETSLIGKTQAFQEMQPFVEWIQSSVDNIARALTGNLSVADNMDAATTVQSAKGTATSVTLEFKLKRAPMSLTVASQSPVSPAITSMAWQQLANGNTQAILTFATAPNNGVEVRFLAFYS
jgi:hypothetical protein